MDKYKDNDLIAILAAIIYGTRATDMQTAIIDARWLITEVRK